MIWDVAYFLPLQRLQERSQGALEAVRNEVVFINDIFQVESWLILRRALNTIHESPWNTQNSSSLPQRRKSVRRRDFSPGLPVETLLISDRCTWRKLRKRKLCRYKERYSKRFWVFLANMTGVLHFILTPSGVDRVPCKGKVDWKEEIG